jgi:hypothetical protein
VETKQCRRDIWMKETCGAQRAALCAALLATVKTHCCSHGGPANADLGTFATPPRRCGVAVQGYEHFGEARCRLFDPEEIAAWEAGNARNLDPLNAPLPLGHMAAQVRAACAHCAGTPSAMQSASA